MHHHCNGTGAFKFETKDGVVSLHSASSHIFKRLEVNPPGSIVAKIIVRYLETFVIGIKFLDKQGAMLLDAARSGGSKQEIVLEEGERLLCVRSQISADNLDHSTRHCNMVLVIGRME